MRAALVATAIDTDRIVREVSAVSCGAVSLFVGTVRNVSDGRTVTGIEYSAYEAMALREMRAIADECAAKFGTDRIAVEHRLGKLELGDAAIAIAVAHPRRKNAMEGTRFMIEQIKARVPIWKMEHYADGTREWVGQQVEATHVDGAALSEVVG